MQSTTGIMNGLKLILDVETFDHAYDDRGAAGFRVALADPRDQGLIYQDGSNVMPGMIFKQVVCFKFNLSE